MFLAPSCSFRWLKTCPWPKGIATKIYGILMCVRCIKNLSLTQRDCDWHSLETCSRCFIKNLSLTQRDCDSSMLAERQKTWIKNLSLTQRDCDAHCRKYPAQYPLKTCPWPKGIATATSARLRRLPRLKTCPWPKGIATWQPVYADTFKTIKNLSLTQRDCDFGTPHPLPSQMH